MTDDGKQWGRQLQANLRAIIDADDLHSGEAATLLAIAVHAKPDGTAYPGRQRLADMLKVDPQTVSRNVRGLKRKGYIRSWRASVGGMHPHSVYQLIPESDRALVSGRRERQRSVAGESDGTLNPSEGTSAPSDGTLNPSEGTSAPSDGTLNPSEGTSAFIEPLNRNNPPNPVAPEAGLRYVAGGRGG